MFGVKLRIKHSLTHPGDARLKAVLQQWPAIEPRSDFESCVWRRIRTAAAAESTAPGLWVIVRGWLSAEPAWAPAMAATVGLLVGVAMALFAPQTRTGPYFASPLLHSQTLTGAYLTMVSGGTR
ncbi:MAG: hypothetical protein Q8O57_00985 [Kiritimatiellota bacterium]|nr:hypothetical protein [Kiritimatiellota bacterium]